MSPRMLICRKGSFFYIIISNVAFLQALFYNVDKKINLLKGEVWI